MYSTMYTDGALTADAITEGIMTFTAVYSVIVIILAVIMIVANWKIFSKAGQPGWAAIIPIYNSIIQFKIVGLNPWLLLLYIVPFVNFIAIPVLAILAAFRLTKSFGKGIAFGFGILLLPFIFNLILAFGSSEYVGPNGNV